tara:strand:+ start:1078 stop:1701 length:624 start_codon:yes stop_codon:yes gene_type:complete
MKRQATDIFSEWALIDKDKGMQKNHMNAVDSMLKTLIKMHHKPFSFIDAGCGNGWVVRKILEHPLCNSAIGIDGAEGMIQKAKKLDPYGGYVLSDLLEWKPTRYVDIVHSMELIYYFNNPEKLIVHIKECWLKPGGTLIMGLDFYKENIKSHSWPRELDTNMTLLSIKEWLAILNNVGLYNIQYYQTNSSDGFPGTLVLYGTKYLAE